MDIFLAGGDEINGESGGCECVPSTVTIIGNDEVAEVGLVLGVENSSPETSSIILFIHQIRLISHTK